MTTPPPPRALALDAAAVALNTGRYWLPAEAQATVVDAVAAVYEADLDTARRRTVALVERIDAGRAWARQHLPVEQQTGLLGALRGDTAATAIADAFEVPLHLIDTAQPVEHCGNQLPPLIGDGPITECVLRPGHQGSHANEYGARWIETPPTALDAPACVHCDNTRLDPNDLGDWDSAVGRIVPGSQAPCPECVGRDACLDNPLLTAAIGLPVRCPHCDTTVPPTHWTKHLQRHHPAEPRTAPTTPAGRSTDGLRDRYAAAIRTATCTGNCDTSETECARTRIQAVVWEHGQLAEVSGSPEMLADTILATRDTELDRLRADRDRWQHGLEAAEAQLEHHRRTVDRVRALAAVIRTGAPWTANCDTTAAHILAELEPPQEQS